MSVPDSNASQDLRWTAFGTEEDMVVPTCGAPDPYVNLPENNSMQSESNASLNSVPSALPQTDSAPFDPTIALERALEKLENYRELNEIQSEDANSSVNAADQLDQLQAELARKTAAQEEATDSELVIKDESTHPIQAVQSPEALGKSETEEDNDAQLDADFESEFDKHVYGTNDEELDLALGLEAFEGLESADTTDPDPQSKDSENGDPALVRPVAVPLYAEEQPDSAPNSNLPVYDVRDFLDASSAQPEPIKGAYEVDPYYYDFETVQTNKADETEDACNVETDSVSDHGPDAVIDAASPIEPAKDDQLFVANPGDVIQIDGADGFDHIDLACFEIEHATRVNDTILVDDKQGTAFEIRFRNVEYALFANGVTLDLSGNE